MPSPFRKCGVLFSKLNVRAVRCLGVVKGGQAARLRRAGGPARRAGTCPLPAPRSKMEVWLLAGSASVPDGARPRRGSPLGRWRGGGAADKETF